MVVKLDTEKNVGRVVFYKQLEYALDLLPMQGAFLFSLEPVEDSGVQGYFDKGKPFEIAYVTNSSRRAYVHVLELHKDLATGEFEIKVKLSIPVMESILKLRYNLKESQMYDVCGESSQKILKREFVLNHINNLDWDKDFS